MPTQQTEQQRLAAMQAAGLDATQQASVTAGTGYSGTITSAQLSAPAINLPPPPVDNTNYQGITDGAAAASALFDKYISNYAPPPSLDNQYQQDYTASGIDAKQSDLNAKAAVTNTAKGKLAAINAQLAGIVAEDQAIPIRDQQNAEGREITESGLAPITAGQRRMNALRALPLQAQALGAQAEVAAAQGDQELSQKILEQAQTHLDRVFQIHAQDAQAQYEYKNKLRESVYEFASAQEKAKLDALQRKEDKDFTLLQNNLNNAQEYAKLAMDSNQADLAGKITALNPKSPTYTQDLGRLASQIQLSPQAKLDLRLKQLQIQKYEKEISLMGEPSDKDKKATADALKEAAASLPIMKDKIAAVSLIKNLPGLAARVGTGVTNRGATSFGWGAGRVAGGALTGAGIGAAAGAPFGGVGAIPGAIGGAAIGALGALSSTGAVSSMTGSGQQFSGAVHQLVGGLTLDNLIAAKARGATFGALSEGELKLLSDSATAINDWEMKEDGKGIGYWNIDEASFKAELDNIKRLTERAIVLSGGSVFDADVEALFNSMEEQFNAASYY